jgi:hypothetical protein
MGSSVTCCGGELRAEYWPELRDTETGSVDGGWIWTCECGEKFDESDMAAIDRAETARGGDLARSSGQAGAEAAEGAD